MADLNDYADKLASTLEGFEEAAPARSTLSFGRVPVYQALLKTAAYVKSKYAGQLKTAGWMEALGGFARPAALGALATTGMGLAGAGAAPAVGVGALLGLGGGLSNLWSHGSKVLNRYNISNFLGNPATAPEAVREAFTAAGNTGGQSAVRRLLASIPEVETHMAELVKGRVDSGLADNWYRNAAVGGGGVLAGLLASGQLGGQRQAPAPAAQSQLPMVINRY